VQRDDPEAAADAASYDELIGDRLPAERHGMPRRHRDTVLRITHEERRVRHASAITSTDRERP
jgi:hypothetical protein